MLVFRHTCRYDAKNSRRVHLFYGLLKIFCNYNAIIFLGLVLMASVSMSGVSFVQGKIRKLLMGQ